ncbi:MAG: arabinan endo-1,5-alpha-L-arabinosidase [Prevotellaceae bacterium]|nr:arabinan endo-1,5-alpha-L-arabinosidase [Prevotellaceae bacterium]
MKRGLLPAIFPLLFLLPACGGEAPFAPSASANPWKDDYRSVAWMESYRAWGTYNVHDPSCKKFGDYYYMYSTDAIFAENRQAAREHGVPLGYIQVRRSKDLVSWEFLGWAFPAIPDEAVQWVRSHANGKGATNIWAPYITRHNGVYRLYFCVSAFGKKASYIGMAESLSPQGPWTQKGCVVKTNGESAMNAIDPSIVVDRESGRWWMHYGSFFGGLYCVELDPETGLTATPSDLGHLIARRASYRTDNLEAPEIIYHPTLKKYYLFYSYDPLMTTYNIRVARSDKPEGPFVDFFGQDVSDTTNNFPILTAPYQFDGHPGWAGTGHCSVIRQESGDFFMLHQARLSPHNVMMVLHVRQLLFTPDGWPVASPERYAGGRRQQRFGKADLAGEWEVMRIAEPAKERRLEAGQVRWGEETLKNAEWSLSSRAVLTKWGRVKGKGKGKGKGRWRFSGKHQTMNLTLDGETIENIFVLPGHDWEREQETILLCGLDSRGCTFWGKRIK